MHYTIKFGEDAQRQLDRLYTYIAEESGEARAEAYVGGASCLSLATFPECGLKRDDIRPDLRILAYRRSAMIAFAIDQANQDVTIVDVFYGGRDIDAILGDRD